MSSYYHEYLAKGDQLDPVTRAESQKALEFAFAQVYKHNTSPFYRRAHEGQKVEKMESELYAIALAEGFEQETIDAMAESSREARLEPIASATGGLTMRGVIELRTFENEPMRNI